MESPMEISVNDINPIIPSDLYKVIKSDFCDILYKICEKNSLDYNNILDEYSVSLAKLGYKYGIKHRNRKKLDPEKTCMGRKGDGKQCTRGRRDNSEYCKSHANNLPEGRVDEPYVKKVPKNRGRKRINKTKDYIETYIEVLDGETYLVDDKNYVYSYNMTEPEFLGIKIDGVLKPVSEIV